MVMMTCRFRNLKLRWKLVVRNNPAGILLDKLQEIKALPQNLKMVDVWANIFGCNANETRKIIEGLSMLMDLSADAQAAAKAYAPGNPEIFLMPFAKIDQLLNTHHLGGQLSQYMGFLDDANLLALTFTDHVLELAFSKEQPGATKDVRDFLIYLDELLEECLSSALTQDLKQLFIKNLEALRQALINYRVGGETVVQSTLDSVTGSIVRNQVAIKDQFENAQDIVEKTAGFMGKIEELINKTQNLATLASPAVNVLLPFFR